MQIPLNQFEQYIDEVILKRGLSYFKNGHVGQPEEITPGVYEALVSGTEDYTVILMIKKGQVSEYVCSCPYDLGPVCKHIAAVLFYLQQEALDLPSPSAKPRPSKRKTPAKKAKRKTVADQIQDILEKIPHGELKQFILDKSIQDAGFRNTFLTSFPLQNSAESKEWYAGQVKAILRAAAGRDRFIDWNHVQKVGKSVYELLKNAQKHLESKNFRSAIFICCAVMEEMTEALQFSDDSNGDIGGCIDFADDLLLRISQDNLPEEIRISLFTYCLSAFEKKVFDGWDWHLGMLQLAVKIARSKAESQEILSILDTATYSEFEEDMVQQMRLEIIKSTEGDKAAQKFMEQNLAFPNIRRQAIQNAWKSKAYVKAIALAKDGIRQDEKDKPGLAMEWYDWLLKIAQVQKDKEKIIQYARLLFLHHYRPEQDYYGLLKDNMSAKEWDPFTEALIKDLTTGSPWINLHSVSAILIREKKWSRLLEVIQQSPSLLVLEHYEKYLSADFAEELVALYIKEIMKYMKHSTGRNHYQIACRYLRRMIKLGGRKEVEKIVSGWKQQYSNRPALMEELNRI